MAPQRSARTISEIDTLRHQGELLGSVAWDTTVWRALEEITPARLGKTAAARVREHVWKRIEARHGAIPPARVAGRDLDGMTVIQLDTSIVLAHSNKQQAGPTFTKDVQVSPFDHLVPHHRRITGDHATPGTGRVPHRHQPYRDTDQGDHPDPHTTPTPDTDPLRQDWVHPHPDRAHQHTQQQTGRPDALLSRVRLRRPHPRHDRPRSRHRLNTHARHSRQPPRQHPSRRTHQAAPPTAPAVTASPTNPPTRESSPHQENPHPDAQLSPFEQHTSKRYHLITTNTPSTDTQLHKTTHHTHTQIKDRTHYDTNTDLTPPPSHDYTTNQT